MNKELVLKFKIMFENERKKLIYSQSILDDNFNLKQDDLMDEIDLTASELETNMRMRLRNREVLYLKKVDEALSRIAHGTFGECDLCGGDIELRRLEARPTANLCVGCKEESEKREHLHIDGHRPKSLGIRMRLA